MGVPHLKQNSSTNPELMDYMKNPTLSATDS